jgi:hypothetical protein
MNENLRIIIRSMPERSEYREYLDSILSNIEWSYCEGDAMKGFLHALTIAGVDPTLHMEDDILLCKDFESKIKEAIKLHPRNVIQFFSMRKADLTKGSRWDKAFMMTQCFYLPQGYSKLIAEFGRDWKGIIKDPTGYDIMVGDWLRSRHEPYWIHIPSLVDHRICKSLINPRRSMYRQSLTFNLNQEGE